MAATRPANGHVDLHISYHLCTDLNQVANGEVGQKHSSAFFFLDAVTAFCRAVFSCINFTPECPSIVLGFKQCDECRKLHDNKHFFQVRKAPGE